MIIYRGVGTRFIVAMLFIGGGIFFAHPFLANADHQGPQRVVANKYTVTLLPAYDSEGKASFKFFFSDVHTGERLLMPIRLSFALLDENATTPFFKSDSQETTQGTAEFTYQFPHQGLFRLQLEFEKLDEQGAVYRPEEWSLWVPGKDVGQGRYPIGLSEIAGFSALALALLVALVNLVQKKMAKKKI